MTDGTATPPPDSILSSLQERAKELSCLYRVEEILADPDKPVSTALQEIVDAIPQGWRYPEHCRAQISYGSEVFENPGYPEEGMGQCAEIIVRDHVVGRICVAYTAEVPSDDSPFLDEELKLVETVAQRIGHFILHQRLKRMFEGGEDAPERSEAHRPEWRVVLDLVRMTNPKLYIRLGRKMMNVLGWKGFSEAGALLRRSGEDQRIENYFGETNQPRQRASQQKLLRLSEEAFQLAAVHLDSEDILARIRRWYHEDTSSLAVRPLFNVQASLADISEALRRFRQLQSEGLELSPAAVNGARAGLIRRFLTEQLEYINVAKRHLEIEDFEQLLDTLIGSPGSQGKLGGKTAGLFLAANIIRRSDDPALGEVHTPRTWYLPSDGLLEFVDHNNLEEVFDQKYKPIAEVRQEYPHIVQVFKNSHFPREIVKGLIMALDALGDVPLVVRSSSLLEDRLGTAFSGKYKSLFVANRGTRQERLDALMDAIAEVYASTFGPDPLEYRSERGLIDFNEEMGIMIQEVVGTRVGRYFLPAFAGVAFSRNEFRWSARIRREDGLIRLVPGLGTRAVDRLADDYPVLVAPGQPSLRVNVTTDEVVRYSPRQVDVIDLERNCFATLDFRSLLREVGADYPAVHRVVSVLRDGLIRRGNPLTTDFAREEPVVTFSSLINHTDFVAQLRAILETLEAGLGCPVDIEFASDGERFHLLQCRPQSRAVEEKALALPRHVPEENVLFTANRYVSNGSVPAITHVVYVVPEAYDALPSREAKLRVGRLVGRLNKVLPKRKFVLLGPGRWGSRGDIQLGVPVTYSDINNTAMLVEVARKKGGYVPDLSFGTHFFQDLVEASIRYLPLYPDDKGVVFNEAFLEQSPSVLPRLVADAPELADLADTVRVIEVPEVAGGRILRVVMNADRDEAMGYLAYPGTRPQEAGAPAPPAPHPRDDHWRWRLCMAERLAATLDTDRFGVEALYVLGSTKNATAGPESDIDLLVHFRGDTDQRRALDTWLEGWSVALAEMNHTRTGHRTEGLLDVHYITDDDIRDRTSFAVKIDAVTDAARRLPLGRAQSAPE